MGQARVGNRCGRGGKSVALVGVAAGLAVGCGGRGGDAGGPAGTGGTEGSGASAATAAGPASSGTSMNTGGSTAGSAGSAATGTGGAATNGVGGTGITAGATGTPKFDVGVETAGTTGAVDLCEVVDGMDPAPCTDVAPPGSFEPEVQWSWGAPGQAASSVIPLVANFTDDNDDGEIDLCDVPDVLVTTHGDRLVLLDGATGAEHWTSPVAVRRWDTPAVGDIDGDGLVEVVTREMGGNLVAFNHDGTVLWTGAAAAGSPQLAAFALADLDADGSVEILLGGGVYDAQGQLLWSVPAAGSWSATIAADLDEDGDMEVIVDATAYHHDGTLYFANPGITTAYHGTYAQVADLDGDLRAEVLVAAQDGISVLEHDGTVKFLAWGGGSDDANRPVAIHDFDGDDAPEFGASALMGSFAFGVYEPQPSVLWTGGAIDASGQCGGTAFDFLGAGVAQAIYADETTMYAYDETGQVLMSAPRSSLTQIEYPVVADVDNDGAAEIVVVSNPWPQQTAPAVQVLHDAMERWVPARRIWNQHTYHVTNVYEDGRIPQVEPKNWLLLNTYRTQAQVGASGGVCEPEG